MVMGDVENIFKFIVEEWYECKCQMWVEKMQIVNCGFFDKYILLFIGKILVKDIKVVYIFVLMFLLEKVGNVYFVGKVRQICLVVFCYVVVMLRVEVDFFYVLWGVVMQKFIMYVRLVIIGELCQLFVVLCNYKSFVMVICIKMLVMIFVC